MRRSDAVRNRERIVDAASTVFSQVGVAAPVRAISERAGLGMGTLYRHFPTRADLIAAVYRHQVDAAVEAASALGRDSSTPVAALHDWVDVFVDFLVTKHGLAEAIGTEGEEFARLHAYFLDRLVPVGARLLEGAAAEGASLSAYALLRGIGNLCIGGSGPGYDPTELAHALVRGALVPPSRIVDLPPA
ncbi:TetR/AcrR family transcriptional regulator [Brevibacterium sp. GP-SGM9]|uniref:TetR/AcrR family transcriptional regulator n=1 Tax=unclassified Brevibacterium TaxID=2614124 RepID=UPI001E47B7BC|nr:MULTISPECIES: TetR/AcrR family transcriptional regulator [unclassified Brevibacterium]MDK8433828.1 TetR/AcrR family transcriptional regulator [Brevibacterium sp. H-BE7]